MFQSGDKNYVHIINTYMLLHTCMVEWIRLPRALNVLSQAVPINIIYIYKNGCLYVYMYVCLGITLERLERCQPSLVHILLYVCVVS
jgi:hypothetical protein